MKILGISTILFFIVISFIAKNHGALANGSSERNEIVMDADIKEPLAKIPPISMNVIPFLQALFERVWVTKYFGTSAEIYKLSSNMPLCQDIPNPHHARDIKNSVPLWQHECLPLEIKWEANKNDLSGTATLRMMNFDKADEVLEATFEIIRTNSLGAYKIEAEKKDLIIKIIKEDLEVKDFKATFGYTDFLKTYPILEGQNFLEDGSNGKKDATNESEEVRKYFAYRARKYALTIEANSNASLKKENVIEYIIKAPAGFFGMEKDYKMEKAK